MFIYGTWGAVGGAVYKALALDPRQSRPRLTYYEMIDYRRQELRPAVREEAKDGYVHRWLNPQLEQLGVKLPATWKEGGHE